MKRVAALALVVAACGGTTATPTTTDPRAAAALEFAVSAGRALEGTRFSALSVEEVADLVMGLCGRPGSLPTDVERTVASISSGAADGDPGDDAIFAEVLTAGVAEVCPQRVAADLSAAFLASVQVAVEAGAGVEIAATEALNAGLSSCLTLDRGTPGDALVTIAAGLFAVEADEAELLAGAITTEQGVTAGAVLAAAVSFFCPEHTARVQEYLAGIIRSPGA